jgi:hypothetical protein
MDAPNPFMRGMPPAMPPVEKKETAPVPIPFPKSIEPEDKKADDKKPADLPTIQ